MHECTEAIKWNRLGVTIWSVLQNPVTLLVHIMNVTCSYTYNTANRLFRTTWPCINNIAKMYNNNINDTIQYIAFIIQYIC